MLILWDSDVDLPEQTVGITYTWNGYTEGDGYFSLLRYVDNNDRHLRDKYLAFTYALGECEINEKRVIDHLKFDDGLSFWWLTTFVEQHFNNIPISDAIRLLAFEEIIMLHTPQKILLVSSSLVLHQVISNLCQKLGTEYEWKKQKLHSFVFNKKNVYQNLPYCIQGLISLVWHIKTNRKYKKSEPVGWFNDKAVFICNYFANTVPDSASEGHFHSRYWEDLHALLDELDIKVNWLHHAPVNHKQSMDWVVKFNQNPKEKSFHAFISSHCSWSVIIKVVKKWLYLNMLFWKLHNVKDAFKVQESSLSFWPLMKGHWGSALCGASSITNLLFLELFEKIFSELPHQKLGLYLCENHTWERALIHKWKKYGHGKLIGVAHATIRFWDLRYFCDLRILPEIPHADHIALNGMYAVEAYSDVYYPKKLIIECEALRYNYLYNGIARSTDFTENKVSQVLILGDIFYCSTDNMLKLLERAVEFIPISMEFTFKAHPLCPINVEDYPCLNMQVTSRPILDIISDYDLAYVSGITSAAVDVYCAGMPVIVVLNNSSLNFSPLRGQMAVNFVSTENELAESLSALASIPGVQSFDREFFFLNQQLPKWRSVLDTVHS